MNVIPKIDKINKPTFIEDYLTACGIKDIKKYISPDATCFDNPFDYPNMKIAIEALYCFIISHNKTNNKIGILIDSDCDGSCSAALLTIFLKSLSVNSPVFFNHNGKQHGLHDVMDEILDANLDLLFIPDAGTNDVEDCAILIDDAKKKNKDRWIVILDHHLVTENNPYAIVVNPYLGENLNKSISGTGVVQKFCEAYYSRYMNCEWEELGNHYDLVATSLISDVCDLTSIENRAMIEYGLHDGSNDFLNYVFEKCCKNRGINPEGVGWDVAPLCNALSRTDEQNSKLIFFDALVGNIEPEKALKELRRVKRIQDDAVKEVVNQIEPTLDLDHKVIIGFSESNNKSFLGLIANKFCGKYNKPTFLLREMNSTTWTGSFRSPIDLADKINNSGLAKAMGHEAAAGIVVPKANLKRFAKWLDSLDLDSRPATSVTACISPETLDNSFMDLIEKSKIMWGQGVSNPTFYLKLQLDKSNVFIYKKNIITTKIQIGDLSILKFFTTNEEAEMFESLDKFEIEMIVGDCKTNEYLGVITPQCMLLDYEIHPIEKEELNWESLFE